MEPLRRRKKAAWEIALELGVAVSTVSRPLQRLGLGRIARLAQAVAPPQRCEHGAPRGSVPRRCEEARSDRSGGEAHPRRPQPKAPRRGRRGRLRLRRRPHTRLASAEVSPSERGCYAATFLRQALAGFDRLGIRCQRLLKDHAKCSAESKPFRDVCQERGIQQSSTRPCTPRTNGKAERFLQTLERRCASRFVFETAAMRTAPLRPWLTHSNDRRPTALSGRRPRWLGSGKPVNKLLRSHA
jgi:hypothetical protein